MDFKNYSNEVLYGAQIGSNALQAQAVTGSKLSLAKNYSVIAVQTTSNVPVSVFGSGISAPTSMTVTGFYAVNAGGTVGSPSLWGTTAGTITVLQATAGSFSFFGAMIGTGALNATVNGSDTLQVSQSTSGAASGTFVCYITLQTTN